MHLGIVLSIVAYILVMLFISAWLRKRVKNDTDYLLAGRKMGASLIAIMLLATNFGGAFVLGTSQDAYSWGFAAIAFALGICVGLVFLALFTAKPARNGGFVTVPGFLQHRFNSRAVRSIASVLSIVALTGILAGQVGAVASALTAINLEYTIGAIVGTAIIVVFTVLSGMWGVAVTDAIQFVVIVIGLLLVTVIAVSAAGGFSAISEEFTSAGIEQPFNPLNQGWSFFLGAAVPVIVHKNVGQDIFQRVFSANTAGAAARGAAIAGVLTALFAVVPALAGMSTRVLFPNLDPDVGAIPTLIAEVLPEWVAGILIAAIISAVVSTADALLLAAVSNISDDFLLRITRIRNRSTLQLRWSRITTIGLGVVGLVFSLVVPDIIKVLTMAFTIYGSGVFVPFILGMFTKLGGRWSAIAAMATGGITAFVAMIGLVTYDPVPTVAVAVLVSLITYVLVAVITHERADVETRTETSVESHE